MFGHRKCFSCGEIGHKKDMIDRGGYWLHSRCAGYKRCECGKEWVPKQSLASIPDSLNRSSATEPITGTVREVDGKYKIYVKVDGNSQWMDPRMVAEGFSYKAHNTVRAQALAKREAKLVKAEQKKKKKRKGGKDGK